MVLEKYDYELLKSVGNNDIKKLREMIDCGVDINMKEYEKGTTPLHIAAARGHKQALELLVIRGADVNAQDNRGITPLHSLVTNRYDVLALWIIRHGANIHLADNNKFSPYDLAQGWFQKEMIAASEGRPTISEEAPQGNDVMKNPNKDFKTLTKNDQQQFLHQQMQTPAPSQAPQSAEVIKIYYRNESYKSVKITPYDTARDICKKMCEKFNMTAYDKCFDVIEVIKDQVRYLNGNECLLQVKAKWPVIVGPTGNETHLHCHFSITIRKTAPPEAQDLFAKVF